MKKVILILILLTIFVVGCAQQNPQTNAQEKQQAPSATGASAEISIKGFAFEPSTVNIKKGTEVTWTNEDSATHIIVSDTGNDLNSDAISQGETYVHTFSNSGTYNYHCSIHPSMKGTIIVE
jgi:plastocyanin